MERLTAALRALWEDPRAPMAFLEAMSSAPLRLKRSRIAPNSTAASTPEQVRRTLVWMQRADAGTVGFPSSEELTEQIVAGLARADAQAKRLIREELVRHLESLTDPALPFVLRLSLRIPMPEAKPLLLRLLTEPGAPADRSTANAAPSAPANGRNGRVSHGNLRAAVVGALAVLKDPQLAEVFRTILAKYLADSRSDQSQLELCRSAALGLILLDPALLRKGLPPELQNDLVLLDELARRPEPQVRRELSARLNTITPDVRACIDGGLHALRKLVHSAPSRL